MQVCISTGIISIFCINKNTIIGIRRCINDDISIRIAMFVSALITSINLSIHKSISVGNSLSLTDMRVGVLVLVGVLIFILVLIFI